MSLYLFFAKTFLAVTRNFNSFMKYFSLIPSSHGNRGNEIFLMFLPFPSWDCFLYEAASGVGEKIRVWLAVEAKNKNRAQASVVFNVYWKI